MSNEINVVELPYWTQTGTYNIDVPGQLISNSVLYLDLTGVNLTEGSSLFVEFSIEHIAFSGDLPFPTETTGEIGLVFTFLFPRDYSSVYDLASSPEFQNSIGVISNIQPVNTSCDGFRLTDSINCVLPNQLDTLFKCSSGIDSTSGSPSLIGEPMAIITDPSSTQIGLQMIAMSYVDNLITPTQTVYEFYRYNFVQAKVNGIANATSLHSNRGYEVGIVYMDEFNRSTTALVSPNNTINVP